MCGNIFPYIDIQMIMVSFTTVVSYDLDGESKIHFVDTFN